MNALSHHDINVSIDRSEPRIQDLRLTEALSFERPRKIREIIDRYLNQLRYLGKVVCPTVGQTTRGRLGREYWPNEKNARLTFSRQSRSLAPHVRNGRVGIGIPSVKGASKAAPFWYAAFSMVGRSGASSDAPKTRTPCDSGNANPVRPATRDWHLRGRFVATVTRSSAS
jgi:hypothetical protein